MVKLGIEFDQEAQKQLEVPLGARELYPNSGMYLAEVLKEHGVTVAFGVPGGHIWHYIDPISRIGIKTIIFGHEQNAVYAGEAYAQVSGKLAVCYGTVGPGVGNSVSAVHQAWLSNSPILYIAGGHEIEHDKLYNTLQESYATELMGTISKMAQRVVYPYTVKQFVTKAIKDAQASPKGPVVLEFGISCMLTPKEANDQVWFGVWGDHATWIPKWRGEDTAKPLTCGGDPAEIEKAVKAIFESKSPFMVLGDGATWADAGPELEELINLAKIPFTTRRIARAVVSEKHPYYYRGMPPFRKEIDLMISVGAKIGFFDGYGKNWPKTIQISENMNHIWCYVDTLSALMGSPKVVARQMIDYIKANNLQVPAERNAWLEKIQKALEAAKAKRRERAMKYFDHPRFADGKMMHFGYLAQATVDYMEEKYDSKVRIMIDGYTMSDFVMPYLVCTRKSQVLSSSEYAGVGHGLGQAIGTSIAQLEEGDKTPVIAFMGDSGFMNSGLDLEVAVRYKLPIVFHVTNNDGWMPGMKYAWYGPKWDALGEQDVDGGEWLGIPQTGEDRPGIQYEQIAKGLGAYSETVSSHKEYAAALARCFEAAEKGQPAVLNCIMDKTMTNRAVTEAVYCLMLIHLPWEDIEYAGRAARRTFWGGRSPLKGLDEIPPMPTVDNWEPWTAEEIEKKWKADNNIK